MAVRFGVENKRTNAYSFRPEDITVRPELNGRHDTPDISALKASILEHGQLVPVLVRQEAGKPVLCAGFSRWRAISELNIEDPKRKIVISAVYVRLNEQDGFVANWKENRDRNETTPMDDAFHFAQMQKWGWKENEIAKRLGLKVAFVKSRLALAEADESVQKAVSAGRVKPTAAAKIAKLSATQQKALAAKKGPITGRDVADAEGKRRKLTMGEVRAIVEEAADVGETIAVQTFARGLLEKMDGGPAPEKAAA